MEELLVLDSRIRDWVLVPVAVVMFVVPLLRMHLSRLLFSPKRPDPVELREQYVALAPERVYVHARLTRWMRRRQVLAKAQVLRANGALLPRASFVSRRALLTDKERGLLNKDIKSPSAMEKMMDPGNAMDMMKKQVTMVLSQMLLMFWVSHFFSGFILGTIERYRYRTARDREIVPVNVVILIGVWRDSR